MYLVVLIFIQLISKSAQVLLYQYQGSNFKRRKMENMDKWGDSWEIYFLIPSFILIWPDFLCFSLHHIPLGIELRLFHLGVLFMWID